MSDEPDRDWLAWSLRDAREKVAQWPEWKCEAFRVLPDDDAPERRDGGEMMSDQIDRRDDPSWDARAAEWARIEPDGDGWCVVLYGTSPDGERAEDFFLVLHRHRQREDCETVHGSLVQLLGDVIEHETRGRDAALAAADRLADCVHDAATCPDHAQPLDWCGACRTARDAESDTVAALDAYRAARGAR